MAVFWWGALCAGSLVIALFFLKFARQSRDRLFLLFSAGFAVFALHWFVLAAIQPSDEVRPYVYLLRLLAFVLILLGIIDKNRAHQAATTRAGTPDQR